MKIQRILTVGFAAIVALSAIAIDPTATSYSMSQCEGSLIPYQHPTEQVAVPDSLTPVFINHVGRHGSRYPASSANCLALRRILQRADSAGTITRLGRSLAELNEQVIADATEHWGALNNLGVNEQRAIASRMFLNFPEIFSTSGNVRALSSYSPRAMMSMYAFTHQLDRLNNKFTFITSTGRINSKLMRPFDVDQYYLDFRTAKTWEPAYKQYFDTYCPTSAIARVVGTNFPWTNEDEARNAAITQYYVLAGLSTMGLPSAMADYFTPAEANALWSCFNLRQYLQRTASTVSSVPAEIAADLVLNLIETTDAFINGTDRETKVRLRFGHAETLMPLLSLLHIPNCYYLTNYFDTVASNWCDFNVVPMSANLQIIVFKSDTGHYYVRIDHNEKPIILRQGDNAIYYPWGEVRRYLMNCVPLFAQ